MIQMEKILVPTDFSENAENALEYAIEVANILDATIHLVHAFKFTNKIGAFPAAQDEVRLETIEKLKALVKKHHPKLSNPKNKIIYHITRKKPIEGLKYFIKKYHIDLVVMGTKGASGLKGAIWGSIASQLISKVNKPIIAIPKGYNHAKLDKILLSIENTNFDDSKILLPLVTLAAKMKASITTFNLVKPLSISDDGDDYETSDLLLEISDDFHQSYEKDLKSSIMNYINGHEIDMLCMIKKDRGFVSNMLHASKTKQVIFNCPVPMLVLHQ